MPFDRVTLSGRYFNRRDEVAADWRRTFLLGGFLAAIDVLISTIVGYVVYKTFKGYFINPVELGFYCNDATIRHPWRPNTISPGALIATIIGTTPLIICVAETLLFRLSQGVNLLPKWVRSCTFEYLKFIIGFSICISVMEVFKCTFGRLRPYFIDVCVPDWTKIDCSIENNFVPGIFLHAHCTGDPIRIRNARSSFPSGHAAAAAFYAVYMVFYLYRVARAGFTRLIEGVTVLMGLLVMGWTLFVLVTRITDNRHHVNDVIFGSGLGIGFALLTHSLLTRQHIYEEREIKRKIKFE
ncbi:unnamed protein product, partial [Mesorhabditis belari]|uniref:Phosphatidic acid phosphatase type 2/haloperoxidase domain-containing protein n=1 Tax=Mesorhabditis belari TaxID=2138241 RepID=A0AAF3FPE3_9BILA